MDEKLLEVLKHVLDNAVNLPACMEMDEDIFCALICTMMDTYEAHHPKFSTTDMLSKMLLSSIQVHEKYGLLKPEE